MTGVASRLKPASEADRAREIAELAGGVGNIIARAIQKLADRQPPTRVSSDRLGGRRPSPKTNRRMRARVRIYDATRERIGFDDEPRNFSRGGVRDRRKRPASLRQTIRAVTNGIVRWVHSEVYGSLRRRFARFIVLVIVSVAIAIDLPGQF